MMLRYQYEIASQIASRSWDLCPNNEAKAYLMAYADWVPGDLTSGVILTILRHGKTSKTRINEAGTGSEYLV